MAACSRAQYPGNFILKGWQHIAGGRAQRTPPVSSNKSSHPEGDARKADAGILLGRVSIA